MFKNLSQLQVLQMQTNGTSKSIELDCPADHNQPEQLQVNLSTFWYCFLALVTTIGLIVSLVSNMIIIYLFTRTPSLRKNPSNIIAVNLSLSDLLYCSQWPSVIYCSLTQSTWILEYDFVCQSFGFITVSTALASILTVLVMSIERAVVIINSIHAKGRYSIRFAWSVTVIIWLVSLSSCLPPLFGKFNRYTLDPSKTSCTLDYLSRQTNYKLYILVLYVAYWIFPTIIISISYALIIITFKKSSLSLKKLESGAGNAAEQLDLNEANSSKSSSFRSTFNRQQVSGLSSPQLQQQQPSFGSSSRRARPKRCLRDSIKLRISDEKHDRRRRHQKQQLGSPTQLEAGPSASLIGRRSPTSVVELSNYFTCREAAASAVDNSEQRVMRAPMQSVASGRSRAGIRNRRQLALRRHASSLGLLSSSRVSDLPAERVIGATSSGPSSPLTEEQEQEQEREQERKRRLQIKSSDERREKADEAAPSLNRRIFRRFSRGSVKSCQLPGSLESTRERSRAIDEIARLNFAGILNRSFISNCNFRAIKTFNANHPSHQANNSHLTRQVLQYRLAKMSFYLILLWLVSWTPIASLAMINSVFNCRRASAASVWVASTMTKLGPAFDVFIYGISHPKIKIRFKQIIKRMFMLDSAEQKTKPKPHSHAETISRQQQQQAQSPLDLANNFSFEAYRTRAQSQLQIV